MAKDAILPLKHEWNYLILQPLCCSLTFQVMDFNVIKNKYCESEKTCLHWTYRAVFQVDLTSEGTMLSVAHLKQWLPQEHWNSKWMTLNVIYLLTVQVQNPPQGLYKLPCGYAPKYISCTTSNSNIPNRTWRPRSEFWLKSFLRGMFVAKKWPNTTEINNPSTTYFSMLFHSAHLFRTYAREY